MPKSLAMAMRTFALASGVMPCRSSIATTRILRPPVQSRKAVLFDDALAHNDFHYRETSCFIGRFVAIKSRDATIASALPLIQGESSATFTVLVMRFLRSPGAPRVWRTRHG